MLELLVVIAILALLAGLLFPGLAAAKSKARAVACLNHLKQMGLSWQLYTFDNRDQVPPNSVEASSPHKAWVMGWLDFSNSTDNTNVLHLKNSLLWPYHTAVRIWACPSDRSTSRHGGRKHDRVRSYAMNGFMNPLCQWLNLKVILRTTDMIDPSPTDTMLLLDQRADSINDGAFLVDMERERFLDWPSLYHNRSSAICFADGHVRLQRWTDPRTTPQSDAGRLLNNGGTPSPGNRDLRWLRARSTQHLGSGHTLPSRP